MAAEFLINGSLQEQNTSRLNNKLAFCNTTTCVDQFRTNEIDNLRKQDTNLPCRETNPNDYETNICTTSFCKAKIPFNIFCVQSFFSKCTIRSQNRRHLTRQNLQRTPLLLKTKRIGKDSNKRCTKIQLQ